MYSVVVIVQLISVVITMVCVVNLAIERAKSQQKLLMITMICAYCYCLGYMVEILSTTLSQAVAGLKIEYMGASVLAISYIAFLERYFKKRHNRLVFGYFIFISFLTLAAVLWMEDCDWYYRSIEFSYSGLFPHVVIEKGPLYYIFFANHIILEIYGIRIVIGEILKQRQKEAHLESAVKLRTLILLLITTMIPFVPYLFSIAGFSSYYDMAPISFLLATLILLFIVRKDNIFDVVTGAHEQMLAAMHDAVIIVNREMEFLEANKAAVQIFPSLYQYQIGKKCPQEVLQVFDSLGDEFSMQIKGRYYERHSCKVYKEKTLIGYSVLLIDLTNTNELMNQLREMKNQAEQANKAKSTFLANVSHELRTPLNAVIGYSDLILQEAKSKTEADYGYAIREAAKTQLSLINSILDISKIEAGKIDLVNAEYRTMQLFTEVMDIISISAQAKSLQLEIAIDPTIPAILFGDSIHIQQVFINLLNNAVKFTNEGFVKLSVQGSKLGSGCIELICKVIDSGIGMKPEEMKKIFEPFEQINHENQVKVEGTGLGLPISKSLIELMGGTISVESEYAKGSIFTIRLVQGICTEETITGVPNCLQNKEKTKSELFLFAPHARVLCVDDNIVNNRVFSELCKQFGFEVKLADCGCKAIELMKQDQFDLVFLDQMLPGMDGVETLNKMKELDNKNPKMQMLAFTANASIGNREYLLSVGFDDVILKPIGIHELEEVLFCYLPDSVIEQKSSQRKELAFETSKATKSQKVETQAIQVEVGLQHCNMDMELYQQTLQMFINYLPKKLNSIQQYQKKKEYTSYVIEVHALKNNAALIGATGLAELAQALEVAGKEEQFEVVEQKTETLIEGFRKLQKEIPSILL